MILPAKNPSDLQYLTHGNAAASRSMLERRNSMVGLRPPKTKARAEGGEGREGRRRGFIFVFTRLSQRHQCGTKWQVKHNAAEQRDPSFQSWIRRRPMHVHVQYVGHGSPRAKKKKSSLGKAQRAVQCSAVCQAHIRFRCSNPWPWLSSAMPMRIL